MAVGRNCAAVEHRLYSCISCIPDWNAGNNRGSGKRIYSRLACGSHICYYISSSDSKKRETIQCGVSFTRVGNRKMVKENDKCFDSCSYIWLRWFCPLPYAQKEKRRGRVLWLQLRRKLFRMRE